MWAALRSDLSEFVSTVTEEGTSALSALDSKLEREDTNDDNNATTTTNNQQQQQQQSDALLGAADAGDIMVLGDPNSNSYDDDAVVSDEVARLRALEETYTEPLLLDGEEEEEDDDEYVQEVRTFFESFDVASQTDEVTALLEDPTNADTLKPLFEKLVPTTVSYNDFWTRYFYRCDAERVEKYVTQQQHQQQQGLDAAELVHTGLSSVKNLFGSAVAAVQNNNPGVNFNREGYGEAVKHSTHGMAGLFMGQKMNTAVDEDDDDEDEEEELGWDDDDEEEDENYEPEDLDDETEQIDFSASSQNNDDSVSLQNLQEERDSLTHIVSTQQEEINILKQKLVQLSTSSSADTEGNTSEEELKSFKIQILEKDAEIANLKASLQEQQQQQHNDKEDATQILQAEVASLRSQLESAQQDLLKTKEEYQLAKQTFREQELVFDQTLREERERWSQQAPAAVPITQTSSFSSGEKVSSGKTSPSVDDDNMVPAPTATTATTSTTAFVDNNDEEEEEEDWGDDGWGDDD